MSAVLPLPISLLQRLKNQLSAPRPSHSTQVIDLCAYLRAEQELADLLTRMPSDDEFFEYTENGAHAFAQLARRNVFEDYVGPAPLYHEDARGYVPQMRNPQKGALRLVP
jgi:hypothetical protein